MAEVNVIRGFLDFARNDITIIVYVFFDMFLNQLLATRVFLMLSFDVRIRLIAEFTIETAYFFEVCLVRQLTPPDTPVMHVAFGQALWFAPAVFR